MSDIPDIEVILSKLSVKFNRIFYEKEFVGCVNEDLQVLFGNKTKCVVVFPVLSPHYLKALRYQAKLCNLAVLPLGSSCTKSVAVCLKNHLIDQTEEQESKSLDLKMPDLVSESNSSLRKKRPERQLYIPPAQRRSRLSKLASSDVPLPDKENVRQKKTESSSHKRLDISKKKEEQNSRKPLTSARSKLEDLNRIKLSLRDIVFYLWNPNVTILKWRYELQSNSLDTYIHDCEFRDYILYKKHNVLYEEIPVFTLHDCDEYLYILSNSCLFWQPKIDLGNGSFNDDNICANSRAYPIFNWEVIEGGEIFYRKLPMVLPEEEYLLFLSAFDEEVGKIESESSAFKVECNKVASSVSDSDSLLDLSFINYGHYFLVEYHSCLHFLECQQDHNVLDCYLEKKTKLKSDLHVQNESDRDYIKLDKADTVTEVHDEVLTSTKKESLKNLSDNNSESKTTNATNSIVSNQKFVTPNSVIVLDHRIEKTNIKNSTQQADVSKDIIDSKGVSPKKILRKKSVHEEEKEIMRKAKENINRKTRPIMKYVDSDNNNTLKIGKSDVNNWEDLFDDDGQLQEEFFTEIVQKVGSNVSIVKAAEDYTAYASKQLEELEHMVELYDFPSTLETHDIIAAFSELNSESMYVKWVDDTHALLVLGSSTQAQRAMEVSNPLIKVRPMVAASSVALACANKSDLRPAMKRPQTNLQTARRLITTHLGARNAVTREQSAKEREDLKKAREKKKLSKKNEQEAWEGSLKSTFSN